jgi:hypothetical protein
MEISSLPSTSDALAEAPRGDSQVLPAEERSSFDLGQSERQQTTECTTRDERSALSSM